MVPNTLSTHVYMQQDGELRVLGIKDDQLAYQS